MSRPSESGYWLAPLTAYQLPLAYRGLAPRAYFVAGLAGGPRRSALEDAFHRSPTSFSITGEPSRLQQDYMRCAHIIKMNLYTKGE
jgi:hypothetical protein